MCKLKEQRLKSQLETRNSRFVNNHFETLDFLLASSRLLVYMSKTTNVSRR